MPEEESSGRLFLSKVYDLAKEFEWEEEKGEEKEKRKLSPTQRFVVITLFRFMMEKDHCWPTQETLSKLTGLEVRQIRRILEKLDKVGVIKRDKRRTTGRASGNNAYEYKFTKPFIQKSKPDLDVPFDETKPDISDQTKPDICDSQTGHFEHSKVPEKQASSERAGAEYVNNKSLNKSVNQSGENDGLMTDEKEKPESEEGDPLEWNKEEEALSLATSSENFSPPPGAPPRLAAEQIKAIFGGRGPQLVNLLGCSKGDIDLGTLVYPFRLSRKAEEKISRIIGFNPDTAQAPWFEQALKEFAERVFAAHWNWKSKPPGVPFRRRFERAGRSGVLYEWGFYPRSPEQQEERRRALERQKEEAAEAARLEEEERRRLAEKEARLKAFIGRPTVGNYLSFMGFPPRDYKGIRDHIRGIVKKLDGNTSISAIEAFMVGELQREGC